MIVGIVNSDHEAVVSFPLQVTPEQEYDVEAVIDTGFSGSLTLPPTIIRLLSLPFRSRGSAILADGSEAQFDIYAATIEWDGLPRNILVEAADTDSLIGMSLLYGFEITICAVDGGRVTIENLVTEQL